MSVEAIKHKLFDEPIIRCVLYAELAIEECLSKDADIWILVEVHVIFLELFLDGGHRDLGLEVAKSEVAWLITSWASGVRLFIDIAAELDWAYGEIGKDGDCFFLEHIFQVDQEVLGLVFLQYYVDFLLLGDLDEVASCHNLELRGLQEVVVDAFQGFLVLKGRD